MLRRVFACVIPTLIMLQLHGVTSTPTGDLLQKLRKLEEDEEVFFTSPQIHNDHFDDPDTKKHSKHGRHPDAPLKSDFSVSKTPPLPINPKNFANEINQNPEISVSLHQACMNSLANGKWADHFPAIANGALRSFEQKFHFMLSGELYDNIEAGVQDDIALWAKEEVATDRFTVAQMLHRVRGGDPTALALFFDSLMCVACSQAFQHCPAMGAHTMMGVSSSSAAITHQWMVLLKASVSVIRATIQQTYTLIETGTPIEEVLENTDTFLSQNLLCPPKLNLDESQCRQRALAILDHKLFRLRTIATNHVPTSTVSVCMLPTSTESIDRLLSDTSSAGSVQTMRALWNPLPYALQGVAEMASETVITTDQGLEKSIRSVMRARPGAMSKQHEDILQQIMEDVFIPMQTWAHSFVTTNICPKQSYRWSIYFNGLGVSGAEEEPTKKPEPIRLVFDPLAQFQPFEMQQRKLDDVNAWEQLHVEDLATMAKFGNDPFSTALTGLEVWSATQAEFSNVMLAWLKVIVTRKGILPSHLGKVLGMLQRLGSKHEMITLTVQNEVREGQSVVEKIQGYVERTNFTIGEIDTALSLPETAVAWTMMLDPRSQAQVSEQFSNVAGGLSTGFTVLASGFFLWNAIWVQNTVAQRLYSTMQGGLVWADVFIHMALTAATGGIWGTIAGSASIYVAAKAILEMLMEKEWFRRRFPALVALDKKKRDEEFVARRTQVCFTAFYSAVYIAENTARDITALKHQNMPAHAEALAFDKPSIATVRARANSQSTLFNDLLFSLMGDKTLSMFHNIHEHRASGGKIPLQICQRKATFATNYIPHPENLNWDQFADRVNLHEYQKCKNTLRKSYQSSMHTQDHVDKMIARTPCSPSELVLALYHSVVKADGREPIVARAAKAVDQVIQIIASPTLALSDLVRDKVITMIEGSRSFQSKMFQDQDLGILHVWFSLHMFHTLTFHSLDQREAAITVVYEDAGKHLLRDQWTNILDPGSSGDVCDSVDMQGRALVRANGFLSSCPQGKQPQGQCGHPQQMCATVIDGAVLKRVQAEGHIFTTSLLKTNHVELHP